MQIWVYSLTSTQGVEFIESHWEALEWLTDVGFRINPKNRLCSSLEEVEDYYRYWLERRHDLPYEADGVVVKVSPLQMQDQLGVVGPRTPVGPLPTSSPPSEPPPGFLKSESTSAVPAALIPMQFWPQLWSAARPSSMPLFTTRKTFIGKISE